MLKFLKLSSGIPWISTVFLLVKHPKVERNTFPLKQPPLMMALRDYSEISRKKKTARAK